MDWIQYIVATLFAFLGLGCLLLVVIQLPGGCRPADADGLADRRYEQHITGLQTLITRGIPIEQQIV